MTQVLQTVRFLENHFIENKFLESLKIARISHFKKVEDLLTSTIEEFFKI